MPSRSSCAAPGTANQDPCRSFPHPQGLDATDSELFQLTLYRDDLPDTYFAFEAGHLERRHRRTVVELSVTYEPAMGGSRSSQPTGTSATS